MVSNFNFFNYTFICKNTEIKLMYQEAGILCVFLASQIFFLLAVALQ